MSATLSDTRAASPGAGPDEEMLVAAVSRSLWVWDTLALEIGDVAIVNHGGAYADLVALVASWYGALPVLRLSHAVSPRSSSGSFILLDDPHRTIQDVAARLAGRPSVAAVDLSGRSDGVEVLLASLPTFARLLLAGEAHERLTIDFYNNVHRKGLDLHSGVFDPTLERADDSGCRGRLERARRLLQDADRRAASLAALASVTQPTS